MKPKVTRGAAPGDDPLSRTHDLLYKARGGDSAALNALFDIFRDPLERYLHAQLPLMVRSFQDTQDAVQEVMLRMFQALPEYHYQGVGSLWGYLRRIARNYVIDSARERKRWGTAGGGTDTAAGRVTDGKPSPIDQAAAHERFERYERALEKIPERARHAFLMRIELQLDYATIARDCNLPSPDAARMVIARATKRLTETMGTEGRPG